MRRLARQVRQCLSVKHRTSVINRDPRSGEPRALELVVPPVEEHAIDRSPTISQRQEAFPCYTDEALRR